MYQVPEFACSSLLPLVCLALGFNLEISEGFLLGVLGKGLVGSSRGSPRGQAVGGTVWIIGFLRTGGSGVNSIPSYLTSTSS